MNYFLDKSRTLSGPGDTGGLSVEMGLEGLGGYIGLDGQGRCQSMQSASVSISPGTKGFNWKKFGFVSKGNWFGLD